MRGLAALLVLLQHWRNYLFVDFSQLPAHHAVFVPLYLVCAAGHQAVVIFFVLSGYLISGSVFRMLDRHTWSWTAYLTHRLVRLWTVLFPGLLLCALWDSVGIHSHLAPLLYGGGVLNHETQNIPQALGLHIFLKNLFFLQGFRGSALFGSDGALWSLANEFWYYILFPLGLLATRRRTPALARFLYVVAFGAIAWFVQPAILFGFPIWLAGTLLCLLPTPKFSLVARLAAAVLYTPLPFFFARQTRFPLSSLESDYLLTVATFLLLWILLSATAPVQPSPGERTSRELARFSYTLYVVHMPFLLLLTALVAHDTRWLPTPTHLFEALGLLALTLAYGYGIASLTEFRTDTLRRWIETRLGQNTRLDRSTNVSR